MQTDRVSFDAISAGKIAFELRIWGSYIKSYIYIYTHVYNVDLRSRKLCWLPPSEYNVLRSRPRFHCICNACVLSRIDACTRILGSKCTWPCVSCRAVNGSCKDRGRQIANDIGEFLTPRMDRRRRRFRNTERSSVGIDLYFFLFFLRTGDSKNKYIHISFRVGACSTIFIDRTCISPSLFVKRE